jgi:hypothetical protein
MFKNYLFKNYYFFSVATELISTYYRLPFSLNFPHIFVRNIPQKNALGKTWIIKHIFEVKNFIFGGIKDKRYIYTFAVSLFF